MKLLLVSLLFGFAAQAEDVVDFHIVNGTNMSAWNTADTKATAKVGQIIRFYNDDTVIHQLHTNGAPCPHGPRIMPGTTWDCKVSRTYNETENGMLYEHNVGPAARFFLLVAE